MKAHFLYIILSILTMNQLSAQSGQTTSISEDLPYHQIPDYPELYSPGSVAARMVDALGYRFYWATRGLTEGDLAFKPSEKARNSMETITHIYVLSSTMLSGVRGEVNSKPNEMVSFEETRKATLENLQSASNILKEGGDVENYKLVFKRGEETTEYPFWNLLNGPLADAIYHTGQLVTFRRSSGNPMHPGVNVMKGKTKE